METQHVDDRVLAVAGRHGQRLIRDIGVLLLLGGGGDPLCIALIGLREVGDHLGNGGREQQGTAGFWSLGQDEFQIFLKTKVEHFVRFVQNDGGDVTKVDRATHDMVAQPSGRGDDDMRAAG